MEHLLLPNTGRTVTYKLTTSPSEIIQPSQRAEGPWEDGYIHTFCNMKVKDNQHKQGSYLADKH